MAQDDDDEGGDDVIIIIGGRQATPAELTPAERAKLRKHLDRADESQQ